MSSAPDPSPACRPLRLAAALHAPVLSDGAEAAAVWRAALPAVGANRFLRKRACLAAADRRTGLDCC